MAGLSDEQKLHLKNVFAEVNERGCNWPKTDEWQGDSGKRKKFQEIMGVLTARDYNEEETVNTILDKFGLTAAGKAAAAVLAKVKGEDVKEEDGNADDEQDEVKSKRKRTTKVKSEDDDLDDHADGDSPKAMKKAKKQKEPKEPKEKLSEKYVVEENRNFGAALLEIAGLYYKAGENFKGGTYSKAAKAIRECETHLLTGKEAMKLKGIGKSSGSILDELNEKGFCERLETLRAGGV